MLNAYYAWSHGPLANMYDYVLANLVLASKINKRIVYLRSYSVLHEGNHFTISNRRYIAGEKLKITTDVGLADLIQHDEGGFSHYQV